MGCTKAENDQAGPAGNPLPPPSLNRGCQDECRTTTQAAAQTSWVRFLPSVLHSDSFSRELKNGFSWEEGSFLAMLTKYILVRNVWDGSNQRNTVWIHSLSLNGHIKSCVHQLSFGVRKPNQPTRPVQCRVGTNGLHHCCYGLKFSKASLLSTQAFTWLLISEGVHSNFQ